MALTEAGRALFELPSGKTVNLSRIDWDAVTTADDAQILKLALGERAISISAQLDAYAIAPESYDSDWYTRAKTALKWTKHSMQYAQNLGGRLNKIAKAQSSESWERRFVAAARTVLDGDTFYAVTVAMERPT